LIKKIDQTFFRDHGLFQPIVSECTKIIRLASMENVSNSTENVRRSKSVKFAFSCTDRDFLDFPLSLGDFVAWSEVNKLAFFRSGKHQLDRTLDVLLLTLGATCIQPLTSAESKVFLESIKSDCNYSDVSVLPGPLRKILEPHQEPPKKQRRVADEIVVSSHARAQNSDSLSLVKSEKVSTIVTQAPVPQSRDAVMAAQNSVIKELAGDFQRMLTQPQPVAAPSTGLIVVDVNCAPADPMLLAATRSAIVNAYHDCFFESRYLYDTYLLKKDECQNALLQSTLRGEIRGKGDMLEFLRANDLEDPSDQPGMNRICRTLWAAVEPLHKATLTMQMANKEAERYAQAVKAYNDQASQTSQMTCRDLWNEFHLAEKNCNRGFYVEGIRCYAPMPYVTRAVAPTQFDRNDLFGSNLKSLRAVRETDNVIVRVYFSKNGCLAPLVYITWAFLSELHSVKSDIESRRMVCNQHVTDFLDQGGIVSEVENTGIILRANTMSFDEVNDLLAFIEFNANDRRYPVGLNIADIPHLFSYSLWRFGGDKDALDSYVRFTKECVLKKDAAASALLADTNLQRLQRGITAYYEMARRWVDNKERVENLLAMQQAIQDGFQHHSQVLERELKSAIADEESELTTLKGLISRGLAHIIMRDGLDSEFEANLRKIQEDTVIKHSEIVEKALRLTVPAFEVCGPPCRVYFEAVMTLELPLDTIPTCAAAGERKRDLNKHQIAVHGNNGVPVEWSQRINGAYDTVRSHITDGCTCSC
jgi:hypothetical protein